MPDRELVILHFFASIVERHEQIHLDQPAKTNLRVVAPTAESTGPLVLSQVPVTGRTSN